MNLLLKNQVHLVTGGASGIGEATVRTLAAEGATPVILDRNAEKGNALAEELKIPFLGVDLTNDEQLARTVRAVLDAHGAIDGVINNAGINDGVGLSRSPERFRSSLDKNLTHAFALTRYTRQALEQSKHGVIVNVLSKVAFTGQGDTSGYAAAKGALAALTREWAIDFAPHGVRVNAVAPAEVATPMYDNWLNSLPDPDATRHAIEERIPLGKRFTTPQEVADTILFLASPRSSHTTGQILFIDGGYTHLDRAFT
ncbi:MAG: SDR family oxidoreductase [Verrucomicrobiota bacterium]